MLSSKAESICLKSGAEQSGILTWKPFSPWHFASRPCPGSGCTHRPRLPAVQRNEWLFPLPTLWGFRGRLRFHSWQEAPLLRYSPCTSWLPVRPQALTSALGKTSRLTRPQITLAPALHQEGQADQVCWGHWEKKHHFPPHQERSQRRGGFWVVLEKNNQIVLFSQWSKSYIFNIYFKNTHMAFITCQEKFKSSTCINSVPICRECEAYWGCLWGSWLPSVGPLSSLDV